MKAELKRAIDFNKIKHAEIIQDVLLSYKTSTKNKNKYAFAKDRNVYACVLQAEVIPKECKLSLSL